MNIFQSGIILTGGDIDCNSREIQDRGAAEISYKKKEGDSCEHPLLSLAFIYLSAWPSLCQRLFYLYLAQPS
jgi:hypothetical protein